MSFIRKIKRGGKVYYAEVKNQWIDGRCVQKHIRYLGKDVEGKVVLASSISNVEVSEVKLFGPLIVLDYIARKIDLASLLGEYGKELLSMVYAHCVDSQSINKMQRWFDRTDLSFLLSLEVLTEDRLYRALDSIEQLQSHDIQRQIFERVIAQHKIAVSGVVYDVTNTYLYRNKCRLGKLGHAKDGHAGRPLIQIGLAVTRNEGIPICHKVLDGNVHDVRMFQDFLTDFRRYHLRSGLVVYDRGISSARNLKEMKGLSWDTLCGLPMKGLLPQKVRSCIAKNELIAIKNRIRLRESIFYVLRVHHTIDDVKGTLAICFNELQKRELRESRYDEIENAKNLLSRGQSIKPGLEQYFDKAGEILSKKVIEAEEFDGYSCLFATCPLTKEEFIRLYFGKTVIERAFKTIKGIVRVQPVRHWLYDRVVAHVFICYLSYLLLSLLEYHLRKIPMTATQALEELGSMYKVYLRDAQKNFNVSRIVTLSKKQELILKTIDKKLLKS